MTKSAKSDLVVRRIEKGTVIDHIASSQGLRILEFLGVLDDFKKWGVMTGVPSPRYALVTGVPSPKRGGVKDIVKVANRLLTPEEISLVALISPEATINVIENYKLVQKYKVELPETFKGIKGISCPNPNCVTNFETSVPSEFKVESREESASIRCVFCERVFLATQVITHKRWKKH